MGICGSKHPAKPDYDEPADKQQAVKYNEGIRNIQGGGSSPNKGIVKFGINDMVSQNTNDIKKEYALLSPPLGKGAYGEVRKGKHLKTGLFRAVKILSKKDSDPAEQKKFIEEIMILRKLDHPNIIRVIEFFQDTHFMYIVTELCQGGELFDRIIQLHHFNEKKAKETMSQVLSAISYCHASNIVHRDLKPENILYETPDASSNLKIIDFGTSTLYQKNQYMDKRLGTPYYIAPEVINKKYNEKCDIWSLGVILYIILSGTPPFNGANDKKIMERVASGQYSMDIPEFKKVSESAKDLIKKMLVFDYQNRISAKDALSHPWFKDDSMEGINIDANLANLSAFTFRSKLQQIVTYYISNHMASTEEKNKLMKTFHELDVNKDGRLSREELQNGYAKVKDFHSQDIDELIEKYDNDGSGYIDYSEFVAAAIDKDKLLTKQRVENCFALFDKDGNGKISADELKQVLSGARQADGETNVWKKIISEVDKNGDGEIELSEFKDMLFLLK